MPAKPGTYCGHRLSGYNLVPRKDGYRDCRACRAITYALRHAKAAPGKPRIRSHTPTQDWELKEIAEGRDIRSEQEIRQIEMIVYRWLDLIDRASMKKTGAIQ